MSYTRGILDLCHKANFNVPLFLLMFVSGLGVPGPVAGQLVRISRRVSPMGKLLRLQSQARGLYSQQTFTKHSALCLACARCRGHSLEQHGVELHRSLYTWKPYTAVLVRSLLPTGISLEPGTCRTGQELLPGRQWAHCTCFLSLLPPPSPLRFTVRTCVCWPSFSWTTKHCTLTWSLSSFTS